MARARLFLVGPDELVGGGYVERDRPFVLEATAEFVFLMRMRVVCMRHHEAEVDQHVLALLRDGGIRFYIFPILETFLEPREERVELVVAQAAILTAKVDTGKVYTFGSGGLGHV